MLSNDTIREIIEKDREGLKDIKDEQTRTEREKRNREKLEQYMGEDRVVPAWELQEELKEMETAIDWFYTGLSPIDEVWKGTYGDLIVITGPTGSGKTTLAMQISKSLMDQGNLSLWFEYEVSPQELMEKFPEAKPMYYTPRQVKGGSVDWIEERVIEAQLKYGNVHAMFIDHLHFVFDRKAMRNNPSMAIGGIVEELKSIGMKHGVMVFLIAHLGKTKYDQMPEMSDIRDSSFIQQDADAIIMTYRHADKTEDGYIYGDETSVSLQKNRRGGKSVAFRVTYEGNIMSYVEKF